MTRTSRRNVERLKFINNRMAFFLKRQIKLYQNKVCFTNENFSIFHNIIKYLSKGIEQRLHFDYVLINARRRTYVRIKWRKLEIHLSCL